MLRSHCAVGSAHAELAKMAPGHSLHRLSDLENFLSTLPKMKRLTILNVQSFNYFYGGDFIAQTVLNLPFYIKIVDNTCLSKVLLH